MKLHFTSERTRTTLDLAASVLMILAAAALLWSALRAPTTSAASHCVTAQMKESRENYPQITGPDQAWERSTPSFGRTGEHGRL